jgi:site-specific recombinase XerD
METSNLLTTGELASILQVHEHTINILVHSGKIPHAFVHDGMSPGPSPFFNPKIITGWLRQGPTLIMDNNDRLEKLKGFYQARFPEALQALKEFDSHFAIKEPKGFSLCRVKSKKYGFLYYVRYIEKGKVIPSRWCTHTNDKASAERFARENRERLLNAYNFKKNHGLYAILTNYYRKGSSFLETEKDRGRVLSDLTRAKYYNFITKVVIPFLRSQRINDFEEITAPVIAKLQNHLLKKGNKPQTINRFLGGLKAVFDYLVMHGTIRENVFEKVTMLKVKRGNFRVRGCYEIGKLKGVFNREWEDTFSCLLCLVIYTTGMRNSEIDKIRVKDLITIDRVHFIDIQKSKTESGVRIVPIHAFVYQKLTAYIKETGKREDDYIFSNEGRAIQSTVYRKASVDMGTMLNMSETELEKQGISFYSGRHYWKTVMNAEDLGDAEEFFMGHKVSADVAKRYNHRDKQGREKLLKKAREVIDILGKRLF